MPVLIEVSDLGWFPQWWGDSHSPALVEVPASGLLQWRSLVLPCSDRSRWLRPVSVDGPGLNLIPQWLLAWVQFCIILRLRLVPLKGPQLCLDPQRSLAQACSGGNCCFRTALAEVAGWSLLYWGSLPQVCYLRSHWFMPVLSPRSLWLVPAPSAVGSGSHIPATVELFFFFCLRPVLGEVTCSSQLLWRSLAQTCFHRGPWLEPAWSEVTPCPTVVSWWLLPCTCYCRDCCHKSVQCFYS